MYSATANRARARVWKRCRWYISFFRVAKNDSAAALSQHTPVRPTLVRTWLRAQNRLNSAEVYWQPRSVLNRFPVSADYAEPCVMPRIVGIACAGRVA